jgi:hypothetical protein
MEDLKNYVLKDIIKINIDYINFDGEVKTGILEINKIVKDDVENIFKELLEIKFPIWSILTIDNFGYSDIESVKANNTSCFNFRFVAGTDKLSDHAIGLAIDINPVQNPWIHPSALQFSYIEENKGTILKNSGVVKIFAKHGWLWGGNWKNPDYQHFYKPDSYKTELYAKFGINQTKTVLSKFKDFIKKIKL